MDAVAVAIAAGLSVKMLKFRDALKMATFFGLAQALMPLGGYLLGTLFANALAAFDHWIAFALLAGLGVKMILDAKNAAEEKVASPFRTN